MLSLGPNIWTQAILGGGGGGGAPVPVPDAVLSHSSTTSVAISNLETSNGDPVNVTWADGSTAVITSGSGATASYGVATAGNVTLEVDGDGIITQFDGGSGPWNYSLADLPRGLTDYSHAGQNTVSGSLADLPSGLTNYDHRGQNTVSGSLADLPSGLTYYFHAGQNTVVPGTSVWRTSSMRFVRLDGALTTGEVDQLLNNLANVVSWTNQRQVQLQNGGNAARSSASDAAVSTIQGLGATVLTA